MLDGTVRSCTRSLVLVLCPFATVPSLQPSSAAASHLLISAVPQAPSGPAGDRVLRKYWRGCVGLSKEQQLERFEHGGWVGGPDRLGLAVWMVAWLCAAPPLHHLAIMARSHHGPQQVHASLWVPRRAERHRGLVNSALAGF